MTGWKAARPSPAPLASAPALMASSKVDGIESRLVTAIALGEYLPGSRLPTERDLAAALGAGRDSVRAALARLVDRGLIHTQRGRSGGSFVSDHWTESSSETARRTLTARRDFLRDAVEAISLLHGTIAEAAAVNRTDEDIEIMQSCLDDFACAASGRDSQQADAVLHLAITAAAHNSALPEVLLQLESRVSLAAPTHIWGDRENMASMEARALDDHTALVDAIRRGERTEAGKVARRHALIDIDIIDRVLVTRSGG